MEPAPVLTPPIRGFTLAEMVIGIAIIGFISTIVLTGQNDFNRTLVVTDTAYTVALSIRQAQTFGLSSRTYSASANAGYGVHFEEAAPQNYILFSDVYRPAAPEAYCPVGTTGNPDAKPGNCKYESSGGELVQTYTFNRGFRVTQFCGHAVTGGALMCSTDGVGPLVTLDIVFARPSTNSIITGSTAGADFQMKDAMIKISAPTGGERYVCVTKVGQISVSATTCP